VRPAEIPRLMGILPLNVSQGSPPAVRWHREGFFIVEAPNAPVRLFIDPESALPARIDLLDQAGRERLTARLARPERIEVGEPEGPHPIVATLVEVTIPERDARATINLTNPADGREKIQERWFDFERMAKALRPREVVELDADCR
jgi:hypothetical protein